MDCRGQPVMRTVPPVASAGAMKANAFDKSGSITHWCAGIGCGSIRQRPGTESSTAIPASRSIVTVMTTCGPEGSTSAVFTAVRPALNAAPESKRPETNWEEPEASTPTSPPCTWPVPATVNGRCCPSMPTPVDRSASNSGAMGRARACSSPSKTVGA
ncbi:Uncharacterised protein [Mycobacteroides abscessus subsp. abscessus]|nr:Uncharacterised protein [Mycobacteroides abscessus subsp. abscessus]